MNHDQRLFIPCFLLTSAVVYLTLSPGLSVGTVFGSFLLGDFLGLVPYGLIKNLRQRARVV